MDQRDRRDERSEAGEGRAPEGGGEERRGIGRLWSRARERRRRDREREAEEARRSSFAYHETGGGYGGYGGTHSRRTWAPERGEFGGGYSGYGGRGGGARGVEWIPGRPGGGPAWSGEGETFRGRGGEPARGVSGGGPAWSREDETSREQGYRGGPGRAAPRGYGEMPGGGREDEGRRQAVAPRWADEIRAERIGPGAYRRGGPWARRRGLH
jgi:hypothetical protein